MKIGFDLDKIFIDFPPFISPKFIDKFYKKRGRKVLLYRIPSYPEQLFRRMTHTPIFRPAIKDNMEFLKKISKKENKLYLISSRFKFLKKRTAKLIKRYNLDEYFDEMYFNYDDIQPHVFKNEVIRKLSLDLYIDDDFSLIKHVARNNPNTRFLWLNQKIWGRPIGENVFAITNLAEIFKQTGITIKDNE